MEDQPLVTLPKVTTKCRNAGIALAVDDGVELVDPGGIGGQVLGDPADQGMEFARAAARIRRCQCRIQVGLGEEPRAGQVGVVELGEFDRPGDGGLPGRGEGELVLQGDGASTSSGDLYSGQHFRLGRKGCRRGGSPRGCRVSCRPGRARTGRWGGRGSCVR